MSINSRVDLRAGSVPDASLLRVNFAFTCARVYAVINKDRLSILYIE